jgi:hypothetical protein
MISGTDQALISPDVADHHDGQGGAVARRCPAMTRTTRGYEMCHLDEHDPSTPHHVRDRSWSTGNPAPKLRLGIPCGDACVWPEHVVPYLGTPPRQSDAATHQRAGARKRPARPGKGRS